MDDIARLDSVVGDWAPWDDTYIFVQDGNKNYIDSNLANSTFANLRVNFMLFYNTSGHLVHGEGFYFDNGEKIPIPDMFKNDLSPDNILLTHTDTDSGINGIIILPQGPLLIASHPIITSEHKGPIQGILVMASFLDSAEIERLSNITHMSLSLSLFDDPKTPDFRSSIQLLSKEKPILVQPMNEEIVAGYALLDDIEGKPAVVIRAEMPRGIYRQGESTINYIVLLIIGSGLIFGIVILLLLEKNVISRLAFLSSNVSAIGASGNHSMRVSLKGEDELSSLANVINRMLEELEQAEEEKKKGLLFKEIYHRVKNNLQIVISLLNLQSQKIKDNKVRDIFKDSQNRIKSIALIHERLYKTKDLAGINFKEYIEDLTNNLFHSYGVNPARNLKIDIDNVVMNLDTATPCGLIVTELVSNSLKHAFPQSHEGNILIRLKSNNNNNFILTISDNGIGIPEDIDFRKTKTLGLQLVANLVGQLKGTIELDRSSGTEFKITFNEIQAGAVKND